MCVLATTIHGSIIDDSTMSDGLIAGERVEIPSTIVTRIREVYSADWLSPRTPTFSHTEIRTLDGGVYRLKQDKQQLRLGEVPKIKVT